MRSDRPSEKNISRRDFSATGVWLIAGVFSAVLGLPIIGSLLSYIFQTEPEQWVRVCTLSQIDTLRPTEFTVRFRTAGATGLADDVRGVFVIRRGNEILAYTNVCAHMGCSVRWVDWRQGIMCPCHGGVYDRWGNLAGGPPAHSLPIYVSKVQGNDLYVANRLTPRG
jgi:nitrite reductase/ring-hydroxylating ferredoxin subunit